MWSRNTPELQILRLVVVLSDGAEETWGLLRLPLAEVLSHGEHQVFT